MKRIVFVGAVLMATMGVEAASVNSSGRFMQRPVQLGSLPNNQMVISNDKYSGAHVVDGKYVGTVGYGSTQESGISSVYTLTPTGGRLDYLTSFSFTIESAIDGPQRWAVVDSYGTLAGGDLQNDGLFHTISTDIGLYFDGALGKSIYLYVYGVANPSPVDVNFSISDITVTARVVTVPRDDMTGLELPRDYLPATPVVIDPVNMTWNADVTAAGVPLPGAACGGAALLAVGLGRRRRAE